MSERKGVQRAMQSLLDTDSMNAGVSSQWTALEHGRLHHLEAGTGPVVVLLHGGTGGGANWFRQIGRLAARHRVLAPDLPGFGLSDPAEPEAPLGKAAAGIFHEWMRGLDVRDALVVGTSFGGLVALRLAADAPEHVSRLMLLDSAGFGRGIHSTVRLASARSLTAAAVRPTRRGTGFLLRTLLTSNRAAIAPGMIDALTDYLYETGTAAGVNYLVRTLRLFAGPGGQREVFAESELGSIRQPVSVVWGARDRMLPVSHAYRAASALPGARLCVIPAAGHSPNWETPEFVIDEIARLAARPVPSGPA